MAAGLAVSGRQILSVARRGAGDPTYRVDDAGAHWRGIRAPTGPTALRVWETASSGEVCAEAWGEGAEWVLDQLPQMLGAEDDWSGFEPRHPLWSRRAGATRTGGSGAPAW